MFRYEIVKHKFDDRTSYWVFGEDKDKPIARLDSEDDCILVTDALNKAKANEVLND